MRICIVTVYNSLNCGSFLQAFMLLKTLQSEKNEVSFLETKARKPFRLALESSLICLIKLKYKSFIFIWKQWFKFRKLALEFPKCKMDQTSIKKQDVFIMGSDEIWNVSRKAFSKYPIFWGVGLSAKKIIAYAPSINRASLEQITKLQYPKKALSKFKAIGVRDAYTKKVLRSLTDKDIQIVLDPTLLVDDNFYLKYETPIKEKNYILVYVYSDQLNREQIKSIKKYARYKKMPLISISNPLDWCDINIPASPFEFLSYYRNASYVITNTFHGTLFSVIYKKQFICYAGDNTKILDLLELLILQSRNPKDNSITEILEPVLDYNLSYQILEKLKAQSIDYLCDAIQ